MGYIEISENNINELQNDNVKTLLKDLKTKGVGKENKFSYSIITVNKEIGFKGAFPKGELKEYSKSGEKYYKYLISKNELGKVKTPTGLELKCPPLKTEEELEKLNQTIDYSDFKASMGVDISSGKHYTVDLIDQLHTMILGGTGSGKSVLLKFLLLQILQNKYSELYIIDKVDFQCLEGTQKCRYRGIFENMTAQDFFAFKNYFLLEYARRQKIFKDNGVTNYDEYKSLMDKDPSLEKLNYIYILIDEFQSLRKRVANTIDVKIFDNNMKQLLDTVRSTGMCFYFGTQDYLKGQLGETRTAVRNFYLGKMDGCDLLKGDELKTVQKWIIETYLFYYPSLKTFIKVPFSSKTNELLKEYSNDPKNRIKENKIYNSLPAMLNDVLQQTDSDIFNNIDGAYKKLNISDEYVRKLKNTTEYIPFSILIYVILRDLNLGLIQGKNTDIFKSIDFEKFIDKVLWSENILVFKENKKLLSLLESCFELGQDEEEFIEALSDIMNNYLKGILGSTKLDFGDDNEENNNNNGNDTKSYNTEENLNNGTQDNHSNNKTKDDNTLLEISYTGEIKPVSFNSMYYVQKGSGDIRKSVEASKYERTIKDRIISKMNAREIKQTKEMVILDIEFYLGVNVKQNGELSKIGKNDLDNLLKATIDGINNTIIKDDKQVYGIRTKMHYIEKQSNFYKNNKVKIKVNKINKETLSFYKNKFNNNKMHTPEMVFTLSKGGGVEVPSANNMYFISDGKKKTSINTINYKNILQNNINRYKELGKIDITHKDICLYIQFNINNSVNRDLDNMLKATIDSLQNTIIENDNQVLEIICFKTELSEKDLYNAKIKIHSFFYDNTKDILNTEEDNNTTTYQEILQEDGTFIKVPYQETGIIENDETDENYIENITNEVNNINIGNQGIENIDSNDEGYNQDINENIKSDDVPNYDYNHEHEYDNKTEEQELDYNGDNFDSFSKIEKENMSFNNSEDKGLYDNDINKNNHINKDDNDVELSIDEEISKSNDSINEIEEFNLYDDFNEIEDNFDKIDYDDDDFYDMEKEKKKILD